jgi:hypothetical protein
MSTTKFKHLAIGLLVPVAGLGILTAFNRVTAQQPENSSAERAKLQVSQITRIPAERLTVAREAPLSDTGITRYKVRDDRDNLHGVSLDASGNRISQSALDQAVQTINNRGFVGKVEAELANFLTQSSDSTINVVVQLKGAKVASVRGNERSNEQDDAKLNTIRSLNAAIQQPIVNQLKTKNRQVIYQSAYGPVVVAAVTPEEIKNIAARDDVERIYLERVAKPRLNVSRVVVQANIVNSRSIAGGGRRVGVVEAQRIGNHPNLPAAQRILCRPEVTTAISSHKTQVAGVIQSTDATNRGIAPAITIIDGIGANFSTSEMIAATDCVIKNGVTAVNMSFGSETNGVFDAFARYVDQVVYNTGRTISVAGPNFCSSQMGSPEIAFNVLVVGAFGDNNTTSFSDDIAPCTGAVGFSAFMDPYSPHNDREEPDIVAPGHQILMATNGGGFVINNGTSFAAPQLTGGAGLLSQRKAGIRAEEVRAIMMASARHNIEGSSRLSERDGAGAIMLAVADTVVANSLSKLFSNNGAASNFPINSTFTASTGQKVRVAIAWSHKMPAGSTMTQPTTDLDLTIKHPNGSEVAKSMSFDNNYEIVEFTAPITGTYTAKISNYRPSSGNEYIGLAVSKTDF